METAFLWPLPPHSSSSSPGIFPFPALAFPRPFPATSPSLLRPLRVAFPGLRVLSPHGLSSGHIAFPAPTPPASLFFGSGALRFRSLLAPVPPVSVLPPAPPVPPSGSCLFPLSERGRIVPGWGCFVRLRLQKYQSVRPKEEKIFGETAAKSYLVERNPSNP